MKTTLLSILAVAILYGSQLVVAYIANKLFGTIGAIAVTSSTAALLVTVFIKASSK